VPPEGEKKKAGDEPGSGPRTVTPETLSPLWAEVLKQVGPMLASYLQKAGLPAISGPNTLVLRFPMSYNHECEHCQDPARVTRVEEVVRKVTGSAWSVRVVADGGSAAAPPAQAAADEANSQSRYRRQRAEALQEPLVKRAIDVLDAQIVQLDDGFGAGPTVPSERADPPDGEEA
jgi:hypothetical protein